MYELLNRFHLQATDMRDGIAKFIYANLFDWLVEQINIALEVGKSRTGRSISILDIYGFESFKNNSFEQFCINYANERLQQHFNRHLFKLEQEEYEEDGIDWTKVEFVDNQECLDLIEKKPIGLLSLLDEESNFPKATDLTFANKLKQHLKTNSCFKGERGRAFRVNHYAGEVS
jgi:myosin-5